MDLIDECAYGEYSVDEKTSQAYRRIFGGSDDSKLVLKDILKHCMWGFDSNDPTMKQQIHDRNMLIIHIKKMLNGKTKQEDEDYE